LIELYRKTEKLSDPLDALGSITRPVEVTSLVDKTIVVILHRGDSRRVGSLVNVWIIEPGHLLNIPADILDQNKESRDMKCDP
jgi:hypothetical protein